MLYRVLGLDIFIDYFEWIYPDKILKQLRKEMLREREFPVVTKTALSAWDSIQRLWWHFTRVSSMLPYISALKDLQPCLAF